MLRTNDEYAGKTKQLTPDEVAHLARELSEDGFATKTLYDFIKDGAIDQQVAYSVLYMKEARLALLCKTLGIELDSVNEREARYADIRHANDKVRRMEAQLGQAVTARHVQAALKVLADKLEYWWDVHGFGHIRELAFVPFGGLKVQFSCHLFSDVRTRFLDQPISQKDAYAAWLAELEERGFELVHDRNEREPSLRDSDVNRALLVQLMQSTFASAKVTETRNHFNNRDGACVPVLRDITVYIHKLEDVEALPDKPQDA